MKRYSQLTKQEKKEIKAASYKTTIKSLARKFDTNKAAIKKVLGEKVMRITNSETGQVRSTPSVH